MIGFERGSFGQKYALLYKIKEKEECRIYSSHKDKLTASQIHLLKFLLDGKREFAEQEAKERLNGLHLDLELPCVVICLYSQYKYSHGRRIDEEIQKREEYVCRFFSKLGLKFFCLLDSNENFQIILPVKAVGTDGKKVNELCILLHQKFCKQFSCDVFIGIGSLASAYSEISNSAAEALEMLAYKYQYADKGVINIANIVRFRYNISYVSNDRFERVMGCFKDGDLGKMALRLDELIAEVRFRPNVSRSSIKRTLIELTVNMLHEASNNNVDVDAVLGDEDPYHWILEQSDTPTIREWLMNLASCLVREMIVQRGKGEKRIIQDACNYIEIHLADNALNLQSVSNSVGLSVTYFSHLFKIEKNIGINSYIKQCRLLKAKQLLTQTDMNVEDIARQTGFSRPNYFGSVFKKAEGISPTEYRKANQKLNE